MSAAPKQRLRQDKPELVAAAVKKALEATGGDFERAVTLLEKRVRANARLRSELLEPFITQACRDAVRQEVRLVRREVWTGTRSGTPPKPQVTPSPRPAKSDSRVVYLAKGNLAMFPLPGGKPLGEATREEVADAAAFYSRQSADMGAKARWLSLIAQSLPAGRTVAEVLTDERLTELQAEARKDV